MNNGLTLVLGLAACTVPGCVSALAADRGLEIGSSYAVVDKGCDTFPAPADICPSVYAYPAKLVVIHDRTAGSDVVYEFEIVGQDLITRFRLFVRETDIPYGRYRRKTPVPCPGIAGAAETGGNTDATC